MNFTQPDGATPLDPNEIEGLIPTHITTKGQLDALEGVNVSEATEWVFSRKRKNLLSYSFICKLHKRMFSDVWKWAGAPRKSVKNIGIKEWWDIPNQVGNLCENVKTWIEHSTYPPDEIAVRFHHKLVYIHPFPNGNGRLARFMADLLIEQHLEGQKFSWGESDPAGQGDLRDQYISALQAADNYDFGPLVEFARI